MIKSLVVSHVQSIPSSFTESTLIWKFIIHNAGYYSSLFSIKCVINRCDCKCDMILTLPKYLSSNSTYLCRTSRASSSLSWSSRPVQKYRLAYLRLKRRKINTATGTLTTAAKEQSKSKVLSCNYTDRLEPIHFRWRLSSQVYYIVYVLCTVYIQMQHVWTKICFKVLSKYNL